MFFFTKEKYPQLHWKFKQIQGSEVTGYQVKLKKNKILFNRGGNISNCFYSSMTFIRNFLLHHSCLKGSIWLQAESSLHLKVSLNNAQNKY